MISHIGKLIRILFYYLCSISTFMGRCKSMLCLLFWATLRTHATDQKWLDSMQLQASTTHDTTVKLACLYSLSFEYGLIEPHKGIEYGKQCLALAKSAHDLHYEFNAYNGMANAYETLADFDSARYCNLQALDAGRRMNNKKMMAISLINLGIGYKEQGDYHMALRMYLSGYKLLENIPDYNPRIHFYIGEIYMRLGDYERAEYHSRRGMSKVIPGAGNEHVLLNLQVNLAKCLLHRKSIDSAMLLLKTALVTLKTNTDQFSLCLGLNALGEAYLAQGQADKAIFYFKEEAGIQEKLKNENGICLAYLNEAACLASMKATTNSVMHALKRSQSYLGAIQENKDVLRNTYQKMAGIYEQIGQPAEALRFFRSFTALSDSILNEEKFRQMHELQARYETEKKEKLIQFQKAELERQESVLDRKKLQLTAALAVFGSLLAFGLFFYYRHNSKQKMQFLMEVQRQERLRELAIAEKEKQERDRISKDIHDDLGSGLSKIALVAEFSKKLSGENSVLSENIQVIARTAKSLGENMRDLVWALNTADSTLDNLAARMQEYGSDHLEELAIRAQMHFPDEVPAVRIAKLAQRNIFLTYKEALNNSIKHAGADTIRVAFVIENDKLDLTMADNGKGFEKDTLKRRGNGLRNMEDRIRQLGGIFTIFSNDQGTSVNIQLDLALISQS